MGREFENDDEVDAYVNSQDNGNDRPSNHGQEDVPKEAPAPTEYEYTARGKTIKEPLDQILKRASQGYDYAQLMNEFNRNKFEFENRSKQFDERYNHYTNVDKWAQENPQKWQFIQSQYQSQFADNQQNQNPTVDQFGQPVKNEQANQPPDPRFQQLEDRLSQHEKFISERTQKDLTDKMTAEDEKLKSDVESIRKEYSYLDFDTPDENGKSLYFKVLSHAQEIGTQSFRVAFRDFNHDRLLTLAEEKGKESIAKDMEKKTKLGLVGSPATRELTPKETRSMSYDDIDREARRAYGI